jgi:uncharacterized protein (TIGR02246 family)
MGDNGERGRATEPEDLSRFFLERANAGDVEGVVALYEPDAALAGPSGTVTTGIQAIRQRYEQLLAGKRTFKGVTQAALRAGDLALTSTQFSASVVDPNGQAMTVPAATAEVARRQPNGTWLWLIDQPNVLA